MACYRTKPAWEMASLETGKKRISFQPPREYRPADYWIPCGKCIGCKTDSRQDWIVRLYHESTLHKNSAMITLIYDDEHLPPGNDLRYLDVQKFLKRMRRDRNEEIRYYIAGEHGEKYGRAHWHMILFGVDYLEDALKQNKSFRSRNLEKLWGLGNTDIIPLSPASIFYVVGYTTKKAGQEGIFRQSRKPPIAKPWVEQNIDYLVRQSQNDGMVGVGNRRYPIPSVYLEWFPKELEEVIERRQQAAAESGTHKLESRPSKNREINHEARVGLFGGINKRL